MILVSCKLITEITWYLGREESGTQLGVFLYDVIDDEVYTVSNLLRATSI